MRTYEVRLMKTVDVEITVQTQHDGDMADESLVALANDVFINQIAQGAVWLHDSWTESVEGIKETTQEDA